MLHRPKKEKLMCTPETLNHYIGRVYVHAEMVARSWVEHTKPLQPPGRHKAVVFDHLVCARGRSPRRSRPDATIFQLRAGI